jgi:ABC-2 type transport system permease protein
MRPYAGERWWPLALMVVSTAALRSRRVALRARRDDGAGLVPRARGRPRRAARSPPARARAAPPARRDARLERGLFFSGVSLGLTGRDAKSLLGDSTEHRDILGSARATSSTSTSRCRC